MLFAGVTVAGSRIAQPRLDQGEQRFEFGDLFAVGHRTRLVLIVHSAAAIALRVITGHAHLLFTNPARIAATSSTPVFGGMTPEASASICIP